MTEIRKIDDKVSEVFIHAGDYSASVYTYGAILHTFCHCGHDILIGYDSYEAYIGNPGHIAEVVGPFANRIADAAFTMDGRTFVLERNDGPNNLHSGSKNFGSKYWKIEKTDDSSVTLSLESPEAGGFPGNHHAEVTYSLTSDDRLSIHYLISSDERCPVNVTNHAYFNLNGDGDIKGHRIMIDAPEYLEVDDSLIPLSKHCTGGTDFDFSSPHAIGERRNGAYDHCFIFGKRAYAEAEGDSYRLVMTTDLPAVQLYTGEYLPEDIPGKGGKKVGPFAGFALETEFFPDFPNRPDFPGAYTEAGKPFETETVYQLIRK